MEMRIQINSRFHILLGLIAGVTASFLQTPTNQFRSTFNSTFLTENGKLHGPIVIPNLTELSEHSYASTSKLQKVKPNPILKNILQSELSRESTSEENSGEEFKPSENRFSSRYTSTEETKGDGEEKVTSITDIPLLLERGEPIPSKISLPSPPNPDSFSHRSDVLNDSEEEKANGRDYPDSSEAREREESEIATTTNEPYSELRTATSIRTSPDEHFENYETPSGVADESDSEEDDSEEKRSLDDYHNSGSKNYHSIQTPLNQIRYRGPHSFGNEFESEKTDTTPDRLRLIKHNWPYTRDKLKNELEENEISDDEENEEWKEEPRTPKTNAKDVGLELAVYKDENRFNRNRTHGSIDEKRRRKQQEKNLAKEEEKDHRSPFYKALKQYTVDEEEPKYPSTRNYKTQNKKHFIKTPAEAKNPKNIFFPTTTHKPKNNTKELTLDFPVHQFLGPVVFDKDNSKTQTTKSYNLPKRDYIKDLERKEKLDHDTNQKYLKTSADKDARYQSFNHLQESDDMYNAILANIQSVFGLRTQPLKTGSGRKNQPEVNLESSALTWSVPLIKRQVKAYQFESVTPNGSDRELKSGSEGELGRRSK